LKVQKKNWQISSINKHLYSYLNILKIFKGFKKD